MEFVSALALVLLACFAIFAMQPARTASPANIQRGVLGTCLAFGFLMTLTIGSVFYIHALAKLF